MQDNLKIKLEIHIICMKSLFIACISMIQTSLCYHAHVSFNNFSLIVSAIIRIQPDISQDHGNIL